MAGKGGTALLVAIAIGVTLGLLDQSRTASSASTTTSTAESTASSTNSSTVSSTAAVTATAGSGSTTASSDSTVVVGSTPGPARTRLAGCPGRVVGQTTQNDLTLRIYYADQAGGTNCLSVTHQGAVTAPGFLRAEIRVDGYPGTDWPRYASEDGDPGAAEVAGAYLVGTNGQCVSATGTYFPTGAGGSSTSVSVAGVGCG